MDCYLLRRRDGGNEVFVQYSDQWTEETSAGRVRRQPGDLSDNLLSATRPVDCA